MQNKQPSPLIEKIIESVGIAVDGVVIDAGCGNNIYKSLFPNIVGFDKHNHDNKPDLVCDFYTAPFKKETADLVLVLGSNQYRSKDLIRDNYKIAWSWVKPGGYLITRYALENEAYLQALKLKFNSGFDNPKRIALSEEWISELEKELGISKVIEFPAKWQTDISSMEHYNIANDLVKMHKVWNKNV